MPPDGGHRSGVLRTLRRVLDVAGDGFLVAVLVVDVLPGCTTEGTLVGFGDLIDHLTVFEVDPALGDLQELGGLTVSAGDHIGSIAITGCSYPACNRKGCGTIGFLPG